MTGVMEYGMVISIYNTINAKTQLTNENLKVVSYLGLLALSH